MPLLKTPVAWQTGAGGTGVSVFYAAFGQDMSTELTTYFIALRSLFPPSVSWAIPGSGDVIDETTGLITGAWIGGTPGATVGSGAGTYAAGTGTYQRWQTAGIVRGRRVRGRTFLCPLISTVYQGDGTIVDTNLNTMNAAANALVASGKMRIWARPSTPGGSDGSAHAVTAAVGPDRVSSLRSRRV
jgi:hypothetical protein